MSWISPGMIIAVSLLLGLFGTTSVEASDSPPSPQALLAFDNGRRAASRGDWETAAKYFADARSRATGQPEFLLNLGIAESHLPGRELRAAQWLRGYLACSEEPKLPDALREAIASLEKKFREDTVELISKASRYVPGLRSQFEQASILWDEAHAAIQLGYITWGRKLATNIPSDNEPRVIFRLDSIVEAIALAGDFHEAKTFMARISDRGQREAAARSIAQTQAEYGYVNDAWQTLQGAKLAPSLELAMLMLDIARKYIEQDDRQSARSVLFEARGILGLIDSKDNTSDLFEALSLLLASAGDFDEAIATTIRVDLQKQESVTNHIALAKAYHKRLEAHWALFGFELDMFHSLLNEARDAALALPQKYSIVLANKELSSRWGLLHKIVTDQLLVGDLDAARNSLNKWGLAQNNNQDNSDLWALLAQGYAFEGQVDRAREVLNLLKKAPDTSGFENALVEASLAVVSAMSRNGAFEEAKQLMKNWTSSPRKTEGFLQIAEHQADRGNFLAAQKTIRSLLSSMKSEFETKRIANHLLLLADKQIEAGDVGGARETLNESRGIITTKIQNVADRAEAYINLSNRYINLGDIANSQQLLQSALSVEVPSTEDLFPEIMANLYLANRLAPIGSYSESKQALWRASDLALARFSESATAHSGTHLSVHGDLFQALGRNPLRGDTSFTDVILADIGRIQAFHGWLWESRDTLGRLHSDYYTTLVKAAIVSTLIGAGRLDTARALILLLPDSSTWLPKSDQRVSERPGVISPRLSIPSRSELQVELVRYLLKGNHAADAAELAATIGLEEWKRKAYEDLAQYVSAKGNILLGKQLLGEFEKQLAPLPLANLFLTLGDVESAGSSLSRAIDELGPERHKFVVTIALQEAKSGLIDEAKVAAAIAAALARTPMQTERSEPITAPVAAAIAKAGDSEWALQYVRSTREHFAGQIQIARVLAETGERVAAQKILDNVKKEASTIRKLNDLARAYLELGNEKEARNSLLRLAGLRQSRMKTSVGSLSDWISYAIAEGYLFNNNPTKARESISRIKSSYWKSRGLTALITQTVASGNIQDTSTLISQIPDPDQRAIAVSVVALRHVKMGHIQEALANVQLVQDHSYRQQLFGRVAFQAIRKGLLDGIIESLDPSISPQLRADVALDVARAALDRGDVQMTLNALHVANTSVAPLPSTVWKARMLSQISRTSFLAGNLDLAKVSLRLAGSVKQELSESDRNLLASYDSRLLKLLETDADDETVADLRKPSTPDTKTCSSNWIGDHFSWSESKNNLGGLLEPEIEFASRFHKASDLYVGSPLFQELQGLVAHANGRARSLWKYQEIRVCTDIHKDGYPGPKSLGCDEFKANY